MDKKVEILEERVVYSGFFHVKRYHVRHRLFRGGMSETLAREVFERPDAVAVLPYDPVDDNVIMIEQFRIGAMEADMDPWLVELIAGVCEPGEHIESVARRESKEEADCALGELLPVASYFQSPGGASERIHLFCGEVDSRGLGGIHGVPEEGEDIRVHVVSAREAFARMHHGYVTSATPLIALQWLEREREALRRRWGTER